MTYPRIHHALQFVRSSLLAAGPSPLAPSSWPLAPFIEAITLAGSHAKGTALPNSDLDILISFAPNTPGPLADLAPWLADHFRDHLPLPRNVSVRITYEGISIDLIPARRRPNSTHHTLWQARTNTWLQTDIAQQIRHVRTSGLRAEIIACKLWSREHHLRFPSFLQELAVIAALIPGHPISHSFPQLLHYLATRFPTARLIDPANSNNVVSDLLLPHEKLRIAAIAQQTITTTIG